MALANFTRWKRQQKRKPHRSGYGERDAATFPQWAPRASSGPPGAMRRAGPDRPRRSLPLSPLRPGSPSRSASEPLGKQRAESCPGPRRSFSHPAGGMGLETEPLFQAWSYFRRRKFRQCSELCSQLLEGAPSEQVGGRAGPGGRGTGLSTCCCCRRNALRSTVREPVLGRAPAGWGASARASVWPAPARPRDIDQRWARLCFSPSCPVLPAGHRRWGCCLRRAPLDALPVPARRGALRVRQVSGAAGSQMWLEHVSGLPTPRAETHRWFWAAKGEKVTTRRKYVYRCCCRFYMAVWVLLHELNCIRDTCITSAQVQALP